MQLQLKRRDFAVQGPRRNEVSLFNRLINSVIEPFTFANGFSPVPAPIFQDFPNERQLWSLDCLRHDLHQWSLHDQHNRDINSIIRALQLGNLYGLLNIPVYMDLSLTSTTLLMNCNGGTSIVFCTVWAIGTCRCIPTGVSTDLWDFHSLLRGPLMDFILGCGLRQFHQLLDHLWHRNIKNLLHGTLQDSRPAWNLGPSENLFDNLWQAFLSLLKLLKISAICCMRSCLLMLLISFLGFLCSYVCLSRCWANESVEDGGALVCPRVLLGTWLAACSHNAAEHGRRILDVVVVALWRILVRRRDVAEFHSLWLTYSWISWLLQSMLLSLFLLFV